MSVYPSKAIDFSPPFHDVLAMDQQGAKNHYLNNFMLSFMQAMRTFFEKVSKCNQMKMNAASVSKLYDLMSMAVKYQISLCNHPVEVVLCTLNHLDSIRVFADGSCMQNFSVTTKHHFRISPWLKSF